MRPPHRSTIKRLLGILTPLKGTLALSTLCRVLNQCLGIALIVVAIWGLMEMIRPSAASTSILPIALTLASLGLVKGVFRYLEQFSGHYVAFRLLSDMRHQLYRRLEKLCPDGLDETRCGDLVSRATADIERIEVFFAHTIAPAIVALVVPLLALVVMATLSPLLALTLLPWLLGVGVVAPWLAHKLGQTPAAEARAGQAALNSHFTDSIQGVREVLIFGANHERRSGLAAIGDALAGAQCRLARCGAFQTALTEIFIGGGVLAVLWVGAVQSLQGNLSAFDLPIAIALTLGAFVPMLGISNLIPDFETAIRSAERFFDILDRQAPPRTSPFLLDSTSSDINGICFRNVSFSYPGEATSVLDQANFHAEPDRITALVGESGAGKSTIVQLLLAFRGIDKGRIFVNGRDVREYTPDSLRERVAVVPQRIHLFNTTIRENLLIARPFAKQHEIEQAARLANIHEFITSLPRGYETPVQEMGSRLSGGQRQRLAIARAFLKRAPILVLDEAGAHLDAESEDLVFQSLRAWLATPSLLSPHTVFLISHRPSWVAQADLVHVLHHGKIIESGTHTELTRVDGPYTQLFSLRDEVLAA